MVRPMELMLIGCGGMGRRYVAGLSRLVGIGHEGFDGSQVRFSCLVDQVRERAQALADEVAEATGHRPAVAGSIAAGLAAAAVDGAVVASSTIAHASICAELVAAGVSILVEKPLTTDVNSGVETMRAAHAAGVVLAVAENVRREPVNRWARSVLRSGRLGRPRFVLDQVFTGADAIQLTPWRHRAESGGLLLDVAVHNADVLEYLLGPVAAVLGGITRLEEPIRRRASTMTVGSSAFYDRFTPELPETVEADADDVLAALLSFTGGAVGQWVQHQAAHGLRRAERTIWCAAGSIELPPDRSGSLPRVTLDGAVVGREELAALADPDDGPAWSLPPVEAGLWGDARTVAGAGDFAYIDGTLVAIELADFVTAVRGGGTPEVDAATGLRAMALVEAVARAGRDGGPVVPAEFGRARP
ncbi:Gfo/Idh/MocA family oxidoreductase [Nakamurella flavida]|uniref:Gfo/Idh/MocA family oxidoreductase n=1 Tax=Nakamurella flavida TaxID=363630 RepID=A0A939C6D7_9ACTN|nr:Gfo/Idh/MocA family oxidoreductase [Nakamurella flavida]MBM9477944.1 Gfo/Idh/MocA family oxidoreductase [Nakamurella flavida]MDP9778340.1 putative dehydrogenase [Nakamurella flavida]